MLGDDPPLGDREVARPGQDVVGDRELAEVVEQAGRPDAVELARSGRSTARASATDASAIIVDGLPAHASRPGERGEQRVLRGVHGGPADVERPRARLGADRRPADRALVAGLAEHVDLVAAERLRRVQRGVGVADQRVEAQHLALAAGDAGGQRDAHELAVGRAGPRLPPTTRRSFSASEAAASGSVSGSTTRNSSPP